MMNCDYAALEMAIYTGAVLHGATISDDLHRAVAKSTFRNLLWSPTTPTTRIIELREPLPCSECEHPLALSLEGEFPRYVCPDPGEAVLLCTNCGGMYPTPTWTWGLAPSPGDTWPELYIDGQQLPKGVGESIRGLLLKAPHAWVPLRYNFAESKADQKRHPNNRPWTHGRPQRKNDGSGS